MPSLVTACSNRLVVSTQRHAFEVPKIRSWWTTLLGLIDDMQERRANGLGSWGRRQDGVAPIVFSFPGGLLNVARRARPLTAEEWAAFDPHVHCERRFADGTPDRISAEPKPDSFGVLDGLFVATGYGN